MPVKHKDQQTISILWVSVTALAGIMLGVVSSYVSINPEVENLQSQGAQLQSVIQEQNRQIASMRNHGTGTHHDVGTQTAAASTSAAGPMHGQVASQTAASNRPIQDLSAYARATEQPAAAKTTIGSVQAAAQPAQRAPDPPSPGPTTSVTPPQDSKDQAGARPPVAAKTPAKAQSKPNPPPVTKPAPKEPSKVEVAAKPEAKQEVPRQETNGLHPDAAKALQHREATQTNNPAAPVKKQVQLPTLGNEIDLPKAVVKATLAQANIAGMDGASVTFKTGLRVAVGGTFRSGEKLLSVNPGAKRIETDRRIIVLEIEDKAD